MEGLPRSLPGFYFDPEKQKYFKIQDTNTATPSQAKYSLESVRKQQKKARAERFALRRSQKREKETIVRPHAQDHLTLATLDREIGSRRRSYYTHGVWPNACMSRLGILPRNVVEPPEHPIRLYDRDPSTKSLYAVHGDNTIKRRRLNTPNGVPLPTVDLDGLTSASLPDGLPFGSAKSLTLNEYSFEPWDILARLTSSVSSLTYLPSSGALAATTYGSDRPPVVYLQFTPKHCSTIWGAVPRPVSFTSSIESNSVPARGTECLAVAASSYLLLFERSLSGDWDSSTALKTNTDILALDWLSPTTIVLGGRNGQIRLYDTRAKGSSHILTHPYPISKLKRADDPTRFVCAGVQDALFLYDIRSRATSSETNHGHYNDRFFNEQYPGPINKKKRLKMKHTTATRWSQPVVTFQHSNSDDIYLDVAVQPELGLIAAAQDTNSSTVIKIHNMWTGKVLKEIPRQGLKTNIKCLKFMPDHNGNTELWSDWNGTIMKMSVS
ncbi:hypothetical protein N0V90_010908 [Kalmusia sp. IMI 367209]|nr:hypothetical protein N0V90_010908 [Kalmusia sp. IMI 367209]